RLPWPGAVAPSGFVRLRADESPDPGHLGFRLPATGGAINLYDATGAEQSRATYTAQTEGVTSGRVPDATGLPIRLPGTPSPGASNFLAFVDGPRLNEFLARNQGVITNSLGRVADFIELHNPAATNVPLTGFSLSVGDAEPGEWAFPAGAVLPAGGHLVVWADPDVPATTNAAPVLQLGRGLPAEGTTLWLFNDRGQALDRVAFGAQLANLSAGRDAGGPWTLLVRPTPGAANDTARPLGDPSLVRLNEWMAGGDDFVEVFNPSELPVNLGGHLLTDDPSLAGRTNRVLAPLTFVAPQRTRHWHASGEPERGPDHLGFRLDARGETLRLLSPFAAIIDSVDFPPQSPGLSEGRWPDGLTNLVRFIGSASPGGLNWLPFDGLVINEVLTHTDAPLEDAVEIANFSGTAADLSGWWLSDDADQLKKSRLPDAPPLALGAFTVLYQRAFGALAQGTNAFALNSAHGGEVWLSEAGAEGVLTGRRAHLAFPALANGESHGRVPTSVGEDLAPLAARTLGQANAAPRVGPIVITEVHYHPMTPLAGVPKENPADEFLELHNPGPAAVSLFHPFATTNTWRVRGGVDFEFPPGTALPAGGHALLVSFPPTNTAFAAIFRANFNVPANVPLYGPLRGRLANEGEAIRLERPDNPQGPGSPDAGFVPWLGVDRVAYASAVPWPVAADGTGQSLQRRRPSLYGNDPLNWRAAAPTAGRPATAPADDTDDDGMPDDWENANQFDRLNPADAAGDADGDGVSNALEYLSGTLPRDAASFLRVDIARDGTGTRLFFRAVAGRSYTLLYRDLAPGGRWRRLYDVPAAGVNRDLGVPDPTAGSLTERYYRLVTPARAAGVE
ncbi:MAG: lamin tail domain-containing protein, partial [Limisphaerales bacterium]